MKKIFLIGLLMSLLASCSHEVQMDESNELVSTNTMDTRSSDKEELLNSSLLNELRVFNESLTTDKGELTQDFSPFVPPAILKLVRQIIMADFVGYVIGYETVKSHGPEIAHKMGLQLASEASNMTAQETTAEPLPGKLPPRPNVVFNDYEKFYAAVLHDPNYDSLEAEQYNLFGNMTLFEPYLDHFETGVHHNLIINKYYSGLTETDIIFPLYPVTVNNLIYSEEFRSQILAEINDAVSGNMDYLLLFSDREAHTINLSQKKAGEVVRLYKEAISISNSLFQIKAVAARYLNTIDSSDEINESEKTVLLNTVPIGYASAVLWCDKLTSNSN